MFAKLGGWQRVGLIVSLGWALFVLGTAAIQYTEADFEDQLSGACPTLSGASFIHWYDARSGKKISIYLDGEHSIFCGEIKSRAALLLDAKEKGVIEPVGKIAYLQLLVAIVLPVFAFWTIIYLLVGAIKWVMEGFQKSKKTSV